MINVYDNFFTKDECDKILAEVVSNRDKWIFNPLTHMYIFGNSFLYHTVLNDNPDNFVNYKDTGKTYSPYAENLLQQRLSTKFPNVKYTSAFSKPGFHIIEPDRLSASQWHYDSDLPLMPYQLEFKDYKKPFNTYFDKIYTIVLMLSNGDYSLDYYPETASQYYDTKKEELNNNPVCASHRNLVGDACPNPDCTLSNFQTVHYKQGTLLMMDERVLHRATNPAFKNSTDLRIIIRGYAVLKNDTLYLYW